MAYNDIGRLGGAKFYMSRHSHQGQHRVAVHKYPESDRVDYVKQGRDEFKFTISAYVVNGLPGVNYEADRDKLWNVLRSGGQKTLHHPYLGTKQVHIRSFSFNESETESGIAKFRMTLSEVAPQEQVGARHGALPHVPMNELMQVASGYHQQEITYKTLEARERHFNPMGAVLALFKVINGIPVFKWLDTASGWLETVGDVMDESILAIMEAQSQVRGMLEYKRQLSRIYKKKDQFLTNIAELYDNVLALVVIGYNPYGQFTTESFSQFESLLEISNFNAFNRNALFGWDPSHPGVETIRAQQKLNADTDKKFGKIEQNPIFPSNVVRTAGFFALVRHAGTMQFSDVTQLDAVQSQTLDRINNFLANEEISTDMRRLVMQMKAGCVQHFRNQRSVVGRVTPITPQSTTNALLLAYNETGRVSSADAIVRTNAIENPFFLEAGTPVNVVRGL